MSKFQLPKPVNDTQRVFSELCEKGGGTKGGPARPRVQQLLRDSGQRLNKLAFAEMAQALADSPSANPWHVCFAVGLCWGRLAILDSRFTIAATEYLGTGSSAALKIAESCHFERGPDPINQSLRGGRALFNKVVLPATLPDTLGGMRRAQDRWLSPILSPERPPYIGSWNATAMFMTALFAQPSLASTLTSPEVMLPPGGPIFAALALLHRTHVLNRAPDGTILDDQAFEPGSVFANTGLMAELLQGVGSCSLIDIHSGLYMLGTRLPESNNWS